MKIYAVADTHGHLEKHELIKTHVLELNPDVLVIAGDVTHKTDPSSFVNLVNELPIPVLAVRGESDNQTLEQLFDECPNTSSLHLNTVSFGGVSFVGLSSISPRLFRNGYSYRDEIIRKIEPFIDSKSVVVTHLPPWGSLDESFLGLHTGCRRLHNLLLAHQPAVLICGHVHNRSSMTYIGKTLVVNCSMAKSGAGAVIEFFSGEAIYANML